MSGEAARREVLLFGGTSEGRLLAEWMDARGNVDVVSCSATEYGGALVSGRAHVQALVGPLSADDKERLMREHRFACVVDATHPYAVHVSESIAALAAAHGVPLLRVARDQDAPAGPGACGADGPGEGAVVYLPTAAKAAAQVAAWPGNVLLTTGSKDLPAFTAAIPDFAERLYCRILPVPSSLEQTRELGIPTAHVVAMQGPFSADFNEALMNELRIAILVTKDSGARGGFAEKLEAARRTGARTVVVARPPALAGLPLDQVKRELEVRYGA